MADPQVINASLNNIAGQKTAGMEGYGELSTLPGFNVLLMGPAGSGKTYDIGTLVDADPKLEVFFLAMEPGMESLFGYWTDRGKPIPENLHWHRMAAPKASFLEMERDAEMINTMNLESLAKMTDPNKSKHDQYRKLFKVLNDFPDDRTGQKFGAVDSWGTNRVLVIDALTGLGRAAMSNVIGGKAVRSQSDWGIAMDQVEKLLRMLAEGCECHIVLIAHVEREVDPVLGGSKIMVATLGAKLAPKIPQMFSDVILCTRSGTKWTWDTASALADVKTRNLPIQADITPDFKQIVTKWKSRGGVI